MSESKGKALIFGAGNVGRGFLGHLLHLSGYALTFADIDQALLQAIHERQGYTLRLADRDRVEDVWIAPVCVVHAEDKAAIAQAIVAADIAVTAVGARALPVLAPLLAAGLAQRARERPDAPLNIILCENLRDAHRVFRNLIRQNLPPDLHGYLDQRVGLVMSVIARMVTTPPAEARAADPTLVIAEPYRRLPVDRHGFVGPIPAIVGLEPRDRFNAWVDWKLYIHNAGHAVLAYLGYRRGHHYGYQALEDPQVGPWSAQAMRESARALVVEHGFDPAQLEADVQDLLRRFANRALADPISRLARDPLRKLAPTDRLVGAATLCLRHGIVPDALSWGIAAGLAFDDPADPSAVELQRRLKVDGLDRVLAEVCGLDPAGELAGWVRARYRRLCAGEIPLPQGEGTAELA
ncbi:MAG: mannitol-1-phosphate 5-dehydrogenase [Anaerolineae bacterium]|nr:mannitol-1-phosphate 5-dehydrogenase [Anaerolineae bacterium]MDW8098614.1 mannitol-1-phosphate 5-dehydrogenase [Anaerolineae bacterium]